MIGFVHGPILQMGLRQRVQTHTSGLSLYTVN
jgi:hypothetical protein